VDLKEMLVLQDPQEPQDKLELLDLQAQEVQRVILASKAPKVIQVLLVSWVHQERLDQRETLDLKDHQEKLELKETKELRDQMVSLVLMALLDPLDQRDLLVSKVHKDQLVQREMQVQLVLLVLLAHQEKLNLFHQISSVHQRLLQEEREMSMITAKLQRMIWNLVSITPMSYQKSLITWTTCKSN